MDSLWQTGSKLLHHNPDFNPTGLLPVAWCLFIAIHFGLCHFR